jgi:hypothetical protein
LGRKFNVFFEDIFLNAVVIDLHVSSDINVSDVDEVLPPFFRRQEIPKFLEIAAFINPLVSHKKLEYFRDLFTSTDGFTHLLSILLMLLAQKGTQA